MLCPAQPRGYGLFIVRETYPYLLIELRNSSAETLLDGLPHQFLRTIELEADIIQRPAVTVVSVISYREDLIVRLQPTAKILLDIPLDKSQRNPQNLLAIGQEGNIIGVLRGEY